jgi:drug/metabolite transporter (DMT)-like permease
VVCALSLSVWLTPQARLDDAVEHALATARQHVRVGVRHAAALVWALLAGMVFAAAMALARGLLSETAALAGYVVIGGMQLVLAISLALAFRYYQARSAALARLDAIADELTH